MCTRESRRRGHMGLLFGPALTLERRSVFDMLVTLLAWLSVQCMGSLSSVVQVAWVRLCAALRLL
jgi:hypothetical protein